MLKIILIFLVVSQLLFSSNLTSASSEESTGADGKTAYTLSCSGTGKDWQDCYREAAALCPDGYTIIKKSTGIVAAPINGTSTLAPTKKLVIECQD